MDLIGNRVKELREKLGISIDDLSRCSKLSIKEIEDIENDMVFPNSYQLSRMSIAMNEKEGYFLMNFIKL
jgi:transcriptional regulator with XRE-family HTH domain